MEINTTWEITKQIIGKYPFGISTESTDIFKTGYAFYSVSIWYENMRSYDLW